MVGALGGVVDRHGTQAVIEIGGHEGVVDAPSALLLVAGPTRPFLVADRAPGIDQAVGAGQQRGVFLGIRLQVEVERLG